MHLYANIIRNGKSRVSYFTCLNCLFSKDAGKVWFWFPFKWEQLFSLLHHYLSLGNRDTILTLYIMFVHSCSQNEKPVRNLLTVDTGNFQYYFKATLSFSLGLIHFLHVTFIMFFIIICLYFEEAFRFFVWSNNKVVQHFISAVYGTDLMCSWS